MSKVEVVAHTIRIPVYLSDQIQALAAVSRRSFSRQVEVCLENSIGQAVESDLAMLRRISGGGQILEDCARLGKDSDLPSV